MKRNVFVLGGVVMMSWFGSLLSAEGIDEERSFPLDGLTGIRTELGSIGLHVRAAAGDVVSVRLHGTSLRRLRLRAGVENGILAVTVERPGGPPVYERVTVDISIPRGRAREVSLATGAGSGNVELDSLELASYDHTGGSGRLSTGDIAADRVSVRTASGSVAMGRLDARSLELTGASANVAINGFRVNQASVETASGNVDLRDGTGTILAKSRSGNIRVAYTSFTQEDATIETASGSARLELPVNAEFSLDARTASGRIRCDFPLTGEGPSGEKHLVGRIGQAPNRVSIETASGSVTVVRR